MVCYGLILVFFIQAALMFTDEFYFHRKRGLPKWERMGHPLDTLTVLVCLLIAWKMPFSSTALWLYVPLALFSCGFVFKDFKIHQTHCDRAEQVLHGFLYVIHPVLLFMVALAWAELKSDHEPSFLKIFLPAQVALVFVYGVYQYVYWNWIWAGDSWSEKMPEEQSRERDDKQTKN